MNPPKGIDPKVWEMALGVAEPINPGTILYGIIAEAAAKTISKAIEAERASWEPAVVYFDRYCQDDADDVEYCISAEHHKDAIAFQAIRNRSNTTPERNEG